MRSRLITVVALASSVVAQVPGLPSCAGSCLSGSFGGCGNFDVKCICSNSAFLSGLSCCVFKSCDAADQEKTIKFADSLCQGSGVTNLPQTASCAADQLSTAGSSSTTSAPSSAATTPSSSTSSEVTVPASLSSELVSISSSVAAAVSSSTGSASLGAAAPVSSSAGSSSTTTSASQTSTTHTTTSAGSGASRTEAAGLGFAIAGLLALL